MIPHYESVMADIGDDQSIVQSLSTFSAHVARLRRILDRATASPGASLVLLDEVGSGTDPSEGSALGMAGKQEVTHHSPLTTHHSPLTTHHSPLTTHH